MPGKHRKPAIFDWLDYCAVAAMVIVFAVCVVALILGFGHRDAALARIYSLSGFLHDQAAMLGKAEQNPLWRRFFPCPTLLQR